MGVPILRPFPGLMLSPQHTFSPCWSRTRSPACAEKLCQGIFFVCLQRSALPTAKFSLGSRGFAPHLPTGSRRKSPGRAEKLQPRSFHTIPVAGKVSGLPPPPLRGRGIKFPTAFPPLPKLEAKARQFS